MHLNRRILLLALSVLVLCVISSAAFKFSPPRSARSGGGNNDNDNDVDNDDSAEVIVPVGVLDLRKKGNSRDYVFAKVNNPKLVRPRVKNSRNHQRDLSEDDDEDAAADERSEESEETIDNENVIKRGKPATVAAVKTKKRERPTLDRDENISEDVDELPNKHSRAGKKPKQRDSDDDDRDEAVNQVVAEKRKKTQKPKPEDDVDEEKPKKKEKKKNKQLSKPKDDDEDKDDDSHWWNFFGFFNREKDEESFLEVIQMKRDEENDMIEKQKQKDQQKAVPDLEEKESDASWRSYLNRKPFSYFFDFEDEEQSEDEKRDTEPEKGTPVDMKKAKTRTGPMSTDDFEEILAYIPSFVPNYTSIENIDCRRQGQIFHRQLRGQKLWAFQMIDAGGKIGSGILHGNINQLGNFDLCTEISTKVKINEETMVRVKGKYCLAHLDIQATDDNLKYLMHLINGKSLLRSTINDPSHFVPRFTTFNWGVCVPAACTVEDVQEFLEASLEDYNSTGIRLNIEIDEENCYVAQKFHWDKLIKEKYEMVGILACVSSVLVVVLLATLNQYWTHYRGANIVIEILDGQTGQRDDETAMISLNGSGDQSEPHGLLNSLILQFSLKDTWSQLTSVKEGEIACVHGFKAIAAIGIFGILKVLQLIRAPYSNRVDLTEILNSSWSLLLRSPMLYMDVFLIISGFLTSYSLLKRFEETGKLRIAFSLFGKVIRMMPMIALTTLFQAHIWPYLGSGPQWNEIVGAHGKLCEEKWWKNLLFIQTSDKIEEACDPISYQFAVQMGLFLVAPGIVWALRNRPHVGLGIFGAINALSVAMRFSQTQTNRLAPVFYHGIKMSQIYRTMDMDHGSIVHRATPFINGLALGFVLIQFGKRVKIPRSSNIVLWISSLAGLGWCLFSQAHVTQRDYIYNASEMAQFSAWVPLIWSYSIMWVIFACYTGNGGFANKLLSSKALVFISRISYALHFVQYVVLSSVSAQTRAVGHFEVSHFVNTFELAVILVISVFLTLTFDLPMQNVRDLLNNWVWTKDQEHQVPEKDVNTDSVVDPGREDSPKKKSSEALFRSNGNLDSSNFDWNREETGMDSGSYHHQKVEREEHLDTCVNDIDSGRKDFGQDRDEEEEEEEGEDGELVYSDEDEHEGGNSAPVNEDLDDIWGSENE